MAPIFVDKHGDEILDGATVIYNGREYTARDTRDGNRMFLQPGNWAPADLRPIPLTLLRREHLELFHPRESDFDEE